MVGEASICIISQWAAILLGEGEYNGGLLFNSLNLFVDDFEFRGVQERKVLFIVFLVEIEN